MTKDLRAVMTVHRRLAREHLDSASSPGEIAIENGKIHNYDKIAEDNGWRFCERCGSYEEYDNDKCKRCSNPLYKYSARGEQNVR